MKIKEIKMINKPSLHAHPLRHVQCSATHERVSYLFHKQVGTCVCCEALAYYQPNNTVLRLVGK